MTLRAAIFGFEGVLFRAKNADVGPGTGLQGPRKDAIRGELQKLFAFLRDRGVRPIIVTNREWVVTTEKGAKLPVDQVLTEVFGGHRLYVASRGDIPMKPQRAALMTVLEKEGLEKREVVVIGMSKDDFRSARNADLLFLNAVWDRAEVDYGFKFGSPLELQRFIDLFALKEHHWFYQIDDPIRYRSLGPFSTFKEESRTYSEAARFAAKAGSDERHFFLNMLVASLYFSGEIEPVAYLACVPGHEAGYGNPQMNDVLKVAGGIFGRAYRPDLILRHRTVPSNRSERIARRAPDPLTQLNSIRLNKHPLKSGDQRYKAPIPLRGKCVLVFDDFTTNGNTFEAARLYLQEAGAEVTLVSWLKTINSDYRVIRINKKFDPYVASTFDAKDLSNNDLSYGRYVVALTAVGELGDAFARYRAYARR